VVIGLAMMRAYKRQNCLWIYRGCSFRGICFVYKVARSVGVAVGFLIAALESLWERLLFLLELRVWTAVESRYPKKVEQRRNLG
jgi:uncharacterized membrane protein